MIKNFSHFLSSASNSTNNLLDKTVLLRFIELDGMKPDSHYLFEAFKDLCLSSDVLMSLSTVCFIPFL